MKSPNSGSECLVGWKPVLGSQILLLDSDFRKQETLDMETYRHVQPISAPGNQHLLTSCMPTDGLATNMNWSVLEDQFPIAGPEGERNTMKLLFSAKTRLLQHPQRQAASAALLKVGLNIMQYSAVGCATTLIGAWQLYL